jgi:Icc-related predicted phosphoesterase
MCRIVIISDTHGQHEFMRHPLPDGDILIHSGDCTNVGTQANVREFVEWYQNLKGYDTKIFIAGNHDWAFERKPAWLRQYINDENLSQSDVVYLEDSEFIIEDPEFSRPIKIYGSPWQPNFMNWAFNVDRDKIYVHWEKIPNDTDVLITHGPPQEILDFAQYTRTFEGCSSLRYHVEERVQPALHVFGHLHESYGSMVLPGKDTLYVNASTATLRYEMINKPIVVDLIEVDGKLITKIIE